MMSSSLAKHRKVTTCLLLDMTHEIESWLTHCEVIACTTQLRNDGVLFVAVPVTDGRVKKAMIDLDQVNVRSYYCCGDQEIAQDPVGKIVFFGTASTYRTDRGCCDPWRGV
jgi:hypothetical protein